jgi:hypothetical protein
MRVAWITFLVSCAVKRGTGDQLVAACGQGAGRLVRNTERDMVIIFPTFHRSARVGTTPAGPSDSQQVLQTDRHRERSSVERALCQPPADRDFSRLGC